eukprot:TRINITY_DN1862_c0_g4_i1.p1 TRINITY_DN1862_c0_g4~~TRINITY_DN1862_c0_g4_i1.p1  ORF type:complete len:405 (-),score=102.91 TRINITY_DN1862_c0_g4_i1:87-1301(-)
MELIPNTTATPETLRDSTCDVHKGCVRDHYCEECKELMCMNCRETHSDGHPIDAVANIAAKASGNLEAIIKDMSTGKKQLAEEIQLKKDVLGEAKKMEETKESLKEMAGKLIDRLFETKIESDMNKFMSQLNKVTNNLAAANYRVPEILKKKEYLSDMVYRERNYQEVCAVYLEEPPSDLIMSKHVEAFEDVKEKLEKLEIMKSTMQIKEILDEHINFTLECRECKKSLIDDVLGKKATLSAKVCEACKEKIAGINWTNGTKITQGTDPAWLTFSSSELMPAYFKCRVKVHQAVAPEKGNRFIGVSKNKCDSTDGYFNTSENWWALHNDKGIWSKDAEGGERGKVTYQNAGDIVTVVYDKTKKLRFEVNGVSTEQSFDGIEGPFYLACADATASQYEIIEITPL